jgi:hypothetical protein
MAQRTKRYQTGREIMEEYVPGFIAQPPLGKPTGEELARALLQTLDERLHAKRVQRTSASRRHK